MKNIKSITNIYANLPHINYIKTNYGWYPDTLITRIAHQYYRQTSETEWDMYVSLLEAFQTDYDVLVRRKRLVLDKDGLIAKERPRLFSHH